MKSIKYIIASLKQSGELIGFVSDVNGMITPEQKDALVFDSIEDCIYPDYFGWRDIKNDEQGFYKIREIEKTVAAKKDKDMKKEKNAVGEITPVIPNSIDFDKVEPDSKEIELPVIKVGDREVILSDEHKSIFREAIKAFGAESTEMKVFMMLLVDANSKQNYFEQPKVPVGNVGDIQSSVYTEQKDIIGVKEQKESVEPMTTTEKNLIIWRALNMLDAVRYREPINDGKGLAHEPCRENFATECRYTYFHNDWGYLMEAVIFIQGRYEVISFESTYNDLVKKCQEMIKHLPKTVWFLENENNKWITKNYKELYDVENAGDESVIPTTNDPSQALSFDTRLKADDYLNCSFQSRHLCKQGSVGFKPKEFEETSNGFKKRINLKTA